MQLPELVRCPKCDSELTIERLTVEGKAGEGTVFLFDCPKDDFSWAVTEKDLLEAMVEVVMERLKQR